MRSRSSWYHRTVTDRHIPQHQGPHRLSKTLPCLAGRWEAHKRNIIVMQSRAHTEPLTCNSVTDCPLLLTASAALFRSTWSPGSSCLMPVISPACSLGHISGTSCYKCPRPTSAWLVHSLEAACNFFKFKNRLFTSQSSSSLDQSFCCVPRVYRSTQIRQLKRAFTVSHALDPRAHKSRAHLT